MSLTLAEGLIDALKVYIEANLPAKLDALDAEYPDTIVLADTERTYVGIKSLRSIMESTVLFIHSPEQRFKARSATGGAIKPTVYVGILTLDQDSETLQRRLYRYGRALVELLLAASPASLPGWAISTEEEWVIDTESAQRTDSESSDFVGEVSLELRAYAWEE